VAYGMIGPIVPRIAERVAAGPALIGALVASFPLAMMLAFGPAGYGIRHGRFRLVLAASLAFSALGAVGFIVGSSFAVFFLARALMGLGSGGLWMCVTMGTLASWPGYEYRSMGRLFAAYMVGGLLGPAVGAIGGIRAPFLAYLGLLVVGGLSGRMLRGTTGAGVFRPDRSALRLRGFWLA
jgi:MFS family permease